MNIENSAKQEEISYGRRALYLAPLAAPVPIIFFSILSWAFNMLYESPGPTTDAERAIYFAIIISPWLLAAFAVAAWRIAYVAQFTIGLPLFLLAKKIEAANVWTSAALGALIGWFVGQVFGDLMMMVTSSDLIGQMMFACSGLFVGLVFWRLYSWRKPKQHVNQGFD